MGRIYFFVVDGSFERLKHLGSVPETLEMTYEAGRNSRDEAALRHDARFNVVELQASVIAHHLAWKRGGWRGWVEKKDTKTKRKENTV